MQQKVRIFAFLSKHRFGLSHTQYPAKCQQKLILDNLMPIIDHFNISHFQYQSLEPAARLLRPPAFSFRWPAASYGWLAQ
jgi:hypothetical protein